MTAREIEALTRKLDCIAAKRLERSTTSPNEQGKGESSSDHEATNGPMVSEAFMRHLNEESPEDCILCL
jgi:hypothetical protein